MTESPKLTEENLRQEKEFIDTALDTQLDTFFLFDAVTGKAIRWNRAFREISGYSDKEISKMPTPASYYSPQDLERASVFIQEVMKTGTGTIDLELICKDGHKVLTEYVVSVIKDDEGKPKHLVSIGRDITESTRTKTELEQSRQLLHTIVENIPAMIFLKDAEDLSFTFFNKAGEQLLGYDQEDLIGKNDYDFFEKAQADFFTATDRGVLDNHEVLEIPDESITVKDGSKKRLRTLKTGLYDKAGNPTRLLGISVDITVEKTADYLLQASETRFRTLFEQSPLSIQIVASDGRTLRVNRAWEVLWGVPFEALANYNLFHDQQLIEKGIMPKIGEAFSGQRVLVPELEYDKAATPEVPSVGEKFWVRTIISPLMHSDGTVNEIVLIQEDLTVRKMMEEALEEKQEQHKEAQQIAHLGHWTLDLIHNNLTWSDENYRIFGLEPGTGNTYETFLKVVHPDDVDFVNRAYTEHVKNGIPYDIEHRLLLPDGSVKWVNERCKTWYGEDGTPLRSIGTTHDITENRWIQEKLVENERLLNEAQAMASIGHWNYDLQTDEISGSDELFRIFGLNNSERTLDTFVATVHPDDRELDLIHIQRGIEHGEDWNIEHRLLLQDGSVRHVNAIGHAITDDNGRTRMLFGTVQDISRRKQAELDLAKKETEINTIFEHAPVIAFYKDGEGRFLRVNRVFAEVLKIPEDEFIGKTVFDLYSPEIAQSITNDDTEVLESGQPKLGIIEEYESDEGKRWVQTDKIPTFDSNGEITGLVGFAMDITEQKLAEEQFRQAQKMETVGTLVGGIAHDFNNMLAAIQGNVYLAKSRLGEQPEVMERLASIERVATQAAEMVQQLLAFARKDIAAITTFLLNDLMKEVVKMARTMIPENINCQISICKEDLNIRGDATQLQQALLNLLNNARDAVAGVANPSISCNLMHYMADDAFRSKHPELQKDTLACWIVRDNGCGIPKTHLDKIFEPFFTTKEVGKGTGLGLAMVFGAVKNHGGIIEVASEEGKGSTFSIYLPVSDEGVESLINNPDIRMQGNGETILLVDDEESVRSTSCSVLENLGYKVIEAADGEEALQIFRANQDIIDLLMTDVVMPRMNGTDLVMHAREIKKDMPAILVTGYDRGHVVNDRFKLARCHVLNKPFDFDDLSQRIRKLFEAIQ